MLKKHKLWTPGMSVTETFSFGGYPPGLVLWVIINQKDFHSENDGVFYPPRDGAEVDEANLKEALNPFEVDLRVWSDQKKYEILKSLKGIYDEFDRDPKKYAGLVILGMSHGINIDGRDYFVTNDCQLLYTEKIADLFHNCYCHGLRNKPKFYMFNICRGDLPNLEIERMNEDYHKMCNDTNDSVEMSSPHENEYDGNGEISFKKGDYMVVYSTIKGFVSKRHRKNGSIFVRELANSINELMTQKNNNFVEMVEHACIATSHRQSSGIVSLQLPEITKTLRAPFDLILKGNITNTKH